MFILLSSIIIASICIQIPSIMGMSGEEVTVTSALKVAAMTIPITFISTSCYTFFYGKGVTLLSYPSLMLIASCIAVFMSIMVQLFWLKSKDISLVEITGMLVAFGGTMIIVYNKEIQELIK